MTDRSLGEWLGYLEQLHSTAIDMGLERVQEVAGRLGLDRPAPLVVTVTGTNGKGSTCAMLAALLRSSDKRVGVYASPHLRRYNERVSIDDEFVDDAELCRAFAVVEQARGAISLTYFEMGTLAALWIFQQRRLDVAVLEVGLGGRLDAVNVIDADLAIVTSIGLDHAEWLGDTRESVAAEKAGIFRPGKPALCGDVEPPAGLMQAASTLGTPLRVRNRDFGFQLSGAGWRWWGVGADGAPLSLECLPMLGLPLENAALALQAFLLLESRPQIGRIGAALSATRIVGRLDRRSLAFAGRQLSLLLDVGHNPHAAQFLAGWLGARRPGGRRLAIFGLLADKDLDGILDAMQSEIDVWAVVPLNTPRSRPVEELRLALQARGARVSAYASVAQALAAVCAGAMAEDQILIFGSFYCVSECLEWLEGRAGEGLDGLAG